MSHFRLFKNQLLEWILLFYCLLSISAASLALFFGRKSDDWGRMFSYNEWIPKLFPKFSEFDILRDGAMKYYDRIKVFIEFEYLTHWIEWTPIDFKSCSLHSQKAIVDGQRRTFDPKHERHFLDMCFKKIEEGKGDPKSSHCCKLKICMSLKLHFRFLRVLIYKNENYLNRSATGCGHVRSFYAGVRCKCNSNSILAATLPPSTRNFEKMSRWNWEGSWARPITDTQWSTEVSIVGI